MCGIAAAFGWVDSDIIEALRRINRAQVHRGPDDEGLWYRDSVALAHRRLAIIDLTRSGHQPMVDPDTGAVVVYNGEVYNFRELRRELEGLGASFGSRSDTEVVLKAWGAWGEACVERFRGMFALAIWDPARRVLFLARDHMGIKPLYYCHVNRDRGRRTLLVASEVRALLASGLVDAKLDSTGLATYVWNGFVHGPETIIAGVRLLAAGCRAVIPLGDVHVQEKHFWSLPSGGGARGSAEALEERLAEAVQLQLVSDVPLGVFLSGGVDSSAVAALARRSADQEVRTFNIAFEERTYDETPYAKAVAASLGTEHTAIPLTRGAFRDALPQALGSLDQPTFDQLNTYFVSRAVREAGLRVVLSGLGGDELFGGYASFVDLPRAARWSRGLRRLPEPARRVLAAAGAFLAGPRSDGAGPQVRWAKLGDVLRTQGRLVDLYQVSHGLFTSDFYREVVDEEVRRAVELGLSEHHRREILGRIEGVSPLHAISLLELSCFAGERLLRDSDAASMAVGLELRVPLLDHRVIEEVSRLEDRLRFRPMGRKRLLRALALREVDASVFERPKSGFVLPIDVWLREELREVVAATLLDSELCARAGLRPGAVAALWQAFAAGARGIYWSRIWTLYVLLWWCQRHGAYLR